MKQVILGVLLLASFSAQAASKTKNIKLNLFNIALGGFGAQAEFKVHKQYSLAPFAFVIPSLLGEVLNENSTFAITGVNGYYYFDEALKQGYYLKANYANAGFDGNVSRDIIGAYAGHTWMFGDLNISLEIGVGSVLTDGKAVQLPLLPDIQIGYLF